MSAQGRRWTGASPATQVRVLAERSLRAALSDRRLLVFGLLQPVVLLLLFSQVFQALSTIPGIGRYDGYVNYLLPATLVNIAAVTAMGSGAGVLVDMYNGVVRRFRAMPMNLVSVVLARSIADFLRLALQLGITVLAAAVLLGYRPHAGAIGTVAAIALTALFGWGLGWVFMALASWLRRAEVLQAAVFIVGFPLMFTTSAYLPVAAMPAWLRLVAAANPLTYAIDAARGLTAGDPVGGQVAGTVAFIVVITVTGGAVCARMLRR